MLGERGFLPYGRHSVDEEDVVAVCDVLRGGWLTTGPIVEAFEKDFSAKVGSRYAVACSNGTAGLHLACLATEVKEGQSAVVPSITFLATANAPRLSGAEIVFADVASDTGLMGEEHLLEALGRAAGKNPSAVLPVHLSGQCVDMLRVSHLARENGLRVIEDACHALGARYVDGTGEAAPVGSCTYSDATVFSLHAVKTITMGEGGVVTTNDEGIYRRLLRYRNHGVHKDADDFVRGEFGFDKTGRVNPWYYEMEELGNNYRVTDVQCALGRSQLRKLDAFVARRRELVALYDRLIEPLAPLIKPLGRVQGCKPAWHLYVVLIDFGRATVSRCDVMTELQERGIGTQVHYFPVQRQPYYAERYGDSSLPGAQSYYERALTLPLFPAMTELDVKHVVDSLRAAVRE